MNIKLNNDRSENVNYDYPDFPVYVRKRRFVALSQLRRRESLAR